MLRVAARRERGYVGDATTPRTYQSLSIVAPLRLCVGYELFNNIAVALSSCGHGLDGLGGLGNDGLAGMEPSEASRAPRPAVACATFPRASCSVMPLIVPDNC